MTMQRVEGVLAMKVLVTAASKYGSTEAIAQAIADEIRSRGVDAHFCPIQDIGDLAMFDAVALGSAVYMGSWVPEAREFVEKHKESLASMPVWLFSSGPIGADDPKPHGDPQQVPSLMETTKARAHRIFAGKLDKSQLGFGDKLIVKVLRAPEGDFRVWEAIRAWAAEVASSLQKKGTERRPLRKSGPPYRDRDSGRVCGVTAVIKVEVLGRPN